MPNKEEKCSNPFFQCESQNSTDIAVDIEINGQRLSVCRGCWEKIAGSDIEWEQPRPRIDEAKDLRKWASV